MKFETTFLALTMALTATTSWAGLDITRMTTAVDDFGGSYTTTSTARAEPKNIAGSSQVEFANFHAGDQSSTINGTVSDEFERTASGKTSVADGSFTIQTTEQSVDVSFSDLLVERQGRQLTLTGQVSANGETYEANELPARLQSVLRKVFHRLNR